MNAKQHIRMTASEIAMGRYMRAPDHPTDEDAFSSAFSEAALVEPPAADAPPADAPPADAPPADAAPADAPPADAPPADAPPADAPPADAPPADKAPVDAPPADAPPADAPPADKAPADTKEADDVLKRLAAAVAAQPPAPAAAPVEAPPADAPPIFSEEERTQLAKFEEDWPEEAKAVKLMQRELGTGVIDYVFKQIAPEVKRLSDLVNTLAVRAHHSDLVSTIEGYTDEEVDKVKEWVKVQPAYLQTAFTNVIEGGTTDEVADLVNRYREATGTQPAGAPAAAPAASGGDTELSGKAKQAAASLAPVGSKRSVVQSPDDSSNFDAAWAQFSDTKV